MNIHVFVPERYRGQSTNCVASAALPSNPAMPHLDRDAMAGVLDADQVPPCCVALCASLRCGALSAPGHCVGPGNYRCSAAGQGTRACRTPETSTSTAARLGTKPGVPLASWLPGSFQVPRLILLPGPGRLMNFGRNIHFLDAPSRRIRFQAPVNILPLPFPPHRGGRPHPAIAMPQRHH
jgi:hypothetical protein